MIPARLLRLNGERFEFLPAPGPEGLRARAFELRRKADDSVVARARFSRARHARLAIEPAARVGRDAIEHALHDLAPLLAQHFGSRRSVSLALASPPAARTTPRVRDPRVELPADYASRTGLSRQREPRVLEYAGLDMFARRQWLVPGAARAWRRMRASAAADGVELALVSAYRSERYQAVLFQRKFARGLSIEEILAVNAAPGYSEHHTGRALDVTCPGTPPAEEIFETTPAFGWLARRAAEFGFAMSYPRGNPHGILYEPWHWCWRENNGDGGN